MATLDEQLVALTSWSWASLRAEWCRLFRAVPGLSDDLLRRDIAYRMQERAYGGLPPDLGRQLKRLTGQITKGGKVGPTKPEAILHPGNRLVRDWHGQTYQVLVLEDGFLFEGRHYASLTRIANEITGTNWSGPRFFGLPRARRAAARG